MLPGSAGVAVGGGCGEAVVATVSSDSHSWNLVVLQLLLEENGYTVRNLGLCTPPTELVRVCLELVPDVVVLSSVNGHGLLELPQLARTMRLHRRLDGTRVVAGGKLTTSGGLSTAEIESLRSAGVDRVFLENNALANFTRFLRGTRRASTVQVLR